MSQSHCAALDCVVLVSLMLIFVCFCFFVFLVTLTSHTDACGKHWMKTHPANVLHIIHDAKQIFNGLCIFPTTVHHQTVNLWKQKHFESMSVKAVNSETTAAMWLKFHNELWALIQTLVLFTSHDECRCSPEDTSGPRTHSCTFSTTLHPPHERSTPDAFSSGSAFKVSALTANKQPAGCQQRRVISHMASAFYSYTHIWKSPFHFIRFLFSFWSCFFCFVVFYFS